MEIVADLVIEVYLLLVLVKDALHKFSSGPLI